MIDIRAIMLLVPGLALGTFGSLYLKLGSEKFTLDIMKLKDNLTVFIGLFLYGLSLIFYTASLKFGDLSVIYPLSSVSYIFIAFLSIKKLGEKMNKLKWIGIALIMFGSFFVAM